MGNSRGRVAKERSLQREGGQWHVRVRKLIDLGNLRRKAFGGFDPLLEVGVVGQLILRLRVQLVQLKERVVRRFQPLAIRIPPFECTFDP